MDIQEMKNYFKNKNESDKLAKQVRDLIKTSIWEKQDMREGFKESFNPLIQSQESIKKSIDEQQNKTLEQLRKNQLALTDKENKLDQLTSAMLAIMDKEKFYDAEDGDGDGDGAKGGDDKQKGKEIFDLNFEKDYDEDEIDHLEEFNLIRPKDFMKLSNDEIENTILNTNKIIKSLNGKRASLSRNNNLSTEEKINRKKDIDEKQNTLKKYKSGLTTFLSAKSMYKIGSGMTYYNNPLQLLDRLELLGGSIIAGNNGVVNEFSQIAHLLAQMSVITKKQLNELLKNYVFNR